MNDLTKLPQWAQREISRLERDMTRMEADMAAIVGAAPTAIEVDRPRVHRGDKPRLFLPDSYSIGFAVRGGQIDVQLKDGALEICGQSDAGDFVVVPVVSNVVRARFTTETI